MSCFHTNAIKFCAKKLDFIWVEFREAQYTDVIFILQYNKQFITPNKYIVRMVIPISHGQPQKIDTFGIVTTTSEKKNKTLFLITK